MTINTKLINTLRNILSKVDEVECVFESFTRPTHLTDSLFSDVMMQSAMARISVSKSIHYLEFDREVSTHDLCTECGRLSNRICDAMEQVGTPFQKEIAYRVKKELDKMVKGILS